MKNLIIYGPRGAGKYKEAMRLLSAPRWKRLVVEEEVVKLAETKCEVDFERVSRKAWHEIYSKAREIGVDTVVGINFHAISAELLEVFHTYMEGMTYILLTEGLSFIPTCILMKCKVEPMAGTAPRAAVAVPKNAREKAYEWLTLGVDMEAVAWGMVKGLKESTSVVMLLIEFLQTYNKNYRRIYHVEHFILGIQHHVVDSVLEGPFPV